MAVRGRYRCRGWNGHLSGRERANNGNEPSEISIHNGMSCSRTVDHTWGKRWMSASQMLKLFEKIMDSSGVISEAERGYFEQRLRNKFHSFLLDKFGEAQEAGLTKAELARRIGKTPDVINRWLGAPSNLTLDTVCDLLLGISGEELFPRTTSPFEYNKTNYSLFDDLCKELVVTGQGRPTIEKGTTNKSGTTGQISIGMR